MGEDSIFVKLFRKKKSEDCERTTEQNEGLLRGLDSTEYKMFLNKGQDDQMEIFYYKTNRIKTALTYLGFILTAGILRLVFHWIPHLYLYATSDNCKIEEAEKILIIELYSAKHKIRYVKPVKVLCPESAAKLKLQEDALNSSHNEGVLPSLSIHFEKGDFRDVDRLVMFSCKKVTYIWDPKKQEFVKLLGLEKGIATDTFHNYRPLTFNENFMRRLVYGPNTILVKESSILTLLFLEVLNPFYIFQIFSFLLWFFDEYYYYAAAILVISMFGIVATVRQTRKNQKNLKSTVHSSDNCTVLRKSLRDADYDELNDHGYTAQVVSTETLVPGDILEIPSHGCIMHCDALLLTGNCILNESMLTGESVPVTKTALPNLPELIYDPKEHSRHTLFCGTHVIQTRYFGSEKVLAVVVRTGFSTAKGSLVRSILYPPPVDFRFEKDSYKFVTMLAVVATFGFVYSVIQKSMRGVAFKEIMFDSLDLITIVVPPALPAAMTVGRFYAQIRLKHKQIFCISPRSINVSGGINCVCFDKTGTLTEDGLDLLCVVPTNGKSFKDPVNNVELMPYDTFVYGLVSCHSLTIIDKQIVGDPLDLKMFESTKWVMEEYETADNNKFDMLYPTVLKPPKNRSLENHTLEEELQIGILREFPFSSSSQRMGVIIRRLNGSHFEYYCKGSPEMVLNFVKKETIPFDFHDILESYTQEGYRVIALAHKELKLSYIKVQKVQREAIEKDLNFLGLIVLENRVKPETYPAIQALNEARIRTVMVTGDNILTALSVARDCDIVLPHQSVITVNTDSSVSQPNLYYTLVDHTKSRTKLPKDMSILSNSVSVQSLETLESQLQTSSVAREDVEAGKNNVARPTSLYNDYRFAMTGKTWGIIKDYYPELLPRICTRGSVFARMSPEQKQQLIQELQSLGYCVAMCGDGANDCGALKAAHTGISLSDSEASVASPFTSRNANITCVLDIIREGRAALVTSFGIFKYMASYSLCQFISVLILYYIESSLTDIEFLYIDLAIISLFAFFFGKTESYPGKLDKKTPLSSLVSLSPVLSLFFQLVFIIFFQVAAYEHLKFQDWYVPFNHTEVNGLASVENYTIYTVSSFQYIILAIVFSKGFPYRKSIFSNYGFIISAVILTAVSVYLALSPAQFLIDWFQLDLPPTMDFRYILLGYAAVNFILSILVEHYVVDEFIFKRLRFKYHNINKSKKKYLAIERDLNKDSKWPPLTSEFKSAASSFEPTPECHAEIVFEKDKFDENHVLNRLYDNAVAIKNASNENSNFTTPEHILATPDNKYGTPEHIYQTPDHKLLVNGFNDINKSQEDMFTSENTFSSPTKSDTFKSLSNHDLASSELNIPEIPFDNVSVSVKSPVRSVSMSNNVKDVTVIDGFDNEHVTTSAKSAKNLAHFDEQPILVNGHSPNGSDIDVHIVKNDISQLNAYGISKSPPDSRNEQNLRLEMNNFNINR